MCLSVFLSIYIYHCYNIYTVLRYKELNCYCCIQVSGLHCMFRTGECVASGVAASVRDAKVVGD